jgi:cell wall-associated NlpC family hydrolase
LSFSRTVRNRNPVKFILAIAGLVAAGPGRHAKSAWLTRVPGGPAGRRVIVAALAAIVLVLALAPLTASSRASASGTPKRLTALRWAERQAGKRYCWGGAGPSCFDCSGVVMKAYTHAGIRLPRTTYQILASKRLHRISARQRRRGDLAFYGSGHVELVTVHGTFGATTPGSRVGWHRPSAGWRPTMYFRVG